jgi:hypothetical protein
MPVIVGARVTGEAEGLAVGVLEGAYITPAIVGARVSGEAEGLEVGVVEGE